jgi:hypothetical protein
VGNPINDNSIPQQIQDETLLWESSLQEFPYTNESQVQSAKELPELVETEQIFTFQEQPIEDTKSKNDMDIGSVLNNSSPT